MAGLEVAGLVLASFPLIISALEHYREGINATKRYLRYKVEVESLMIYLTTENILLANNLKLLLTGVVKAEHVVGYFSEPESGSWRTAGDLLQQRLGGVYDVYLEHVKGMAVSLERIKEKLALDIAGKPPFNDPTLFKSAFKQFKFSMRLSDYSGDLEELRNHNQALNHLTRQTEELRKVSRAQTEEPSDPETAQVNGLGEDENASMLGYTGTRELSLGLNGTPTLALSRANSPLFEPLLHSPSEPSSSTRSSEPRSSVFPQENQHLEAFSSTLPTSKDSSKPEPETNDEKLDEPSIQDSDTIFSIDATSDDLEYILIFGQQLSYDLRNNFGVADVSKIPYPVIRDALRAFTWKLYEESANPFQWETSVILRQKKNKIVEILKGTSGGESADEEDGDAEERLPFLKSNDYLSNWINGLSEYDHDGSQQELNEEDEGKPHPFQLSDYKAFVHQSDAYQWLLSRISQHDRLSFGTPDMTAEIGDQILSQLQSHHRLHTMSRHKPSPLASMTFHFEWAPQIFVRSLGLDPVCPNILQRVLCLTGTWREAQAMTVSEYLHQTWPVTAKLIESIMQELIVTNQGEERIYTLQGEKDAQVSIRCEPENMYSISVRAGAHFISEFSQQIAWLAATFRLSPYVKGIAACRPYIKRLSVPKTSDGGSSTTAVGICNFAFDFEIGDTIEGSDSGFCWSSLFHNPVLVTGFPILKRPTSNSGLEMSLSTMAYLVQSDQLVQCGESYLLKGFSSLLAATLVTSSVVLWHLFVSRTPGERISYFHNQDTRLELGQGNDQSLRLLGSSRHIVGWCVEAMDFCGHTTVSQDISTSGLQPSPACTIIDRMYIEGGMHVIGGVNFRPNHKEEPIKVHRERDYPELLQMVAAHPVAFYDIAERRAWLVDGASALLHMVRISLHIDAVDPESPYDWVFDESKLQDLWGNCSGRMAALKTLKRWDHLSLPVYVKAQSVVDGKIVPQFSTFGDRVNKILQWLEVMIDRDIYLAAQDGIKVSQTLIPRKSVSGFDIMDLIKPQGPISPRVAPLNTWGYGWADLFSSTGVTTIFGKGFGDLVRPGNFNSVCTDWKSVPVGSDYMAVSMSTLRMLYDQRFLRMTPALKGGELTSNIVWTSLCHPFQPCSCIKGKSVGKLQHTSPLQSLVPKHSWKPWEKSKNMTPVDISSLDKRGAVVFANLPFFGREVELKVADRTAERENSGSSLTVPSSSSQATRASAGTSDTTAPEDPTQTTTPDEGSGGGGSLQDALETPSSSSRTERLRKGWGRLIKK